MSQKVYKIQNPEGKFSSGSMNPQWQKTGKIWKSWGDLKRHLKIYRIRPDIYKDCSIIEYNLEWNTSSNMDEALGNTNRNKANTRG